MHEWSRRSVAREAARLVRGRWARASALGSPGARYANRETALMLLIVLCWTAAGAVTRVGN
jgi:hypothetical protein